jgi:hypothetical protein
MERKKTKQPINDLSASFNVEQHIAAQSRSFMCGLAAIV